LYRKVGLWHRSGGPGATWTVDRRFQRKRRDFTLAQAVGRRMLTLPLEDDRPAMNLTRRPLLILVALLVAASDAGLAQTQMPAPGPPGWNAAMVRLFDNHQAFSATAEIRVLDMSG
jgi:hypothetical protein